MESVGGEADSLLLRMIGSVEVDVANGGTATALAVAEIEDAAEAVRSESFMLPAKAEIAVMCSKAVAALVEPPVKPTRLFSCE